ncbi:acetylcholine receptor subunit beta-type unc-29-like [Saccostrea echinata]|uniref:acetylcholine receptor subunit beta-type unc-29-like n=1 Tax=Saccostrea echinata TaxID=191078 RepID=UPI002A80A9B5|nr:acetylcholine receptor subunit beta-type unc-29-like [Saccostrea echinata]
MESIRFNTRLLLCLCILYSTYSYNVTDEDLLFKDLFTNYNKELRAGNDRDYPLNVSMSFYLFAIKEFDEATSKFTVNGVFVTTWRDERLSWDPTNYNNITRTLMSQDKIWLPNLVSTNPFEDIYGLGSSLVKIYLYYDGSCVWTTMQSFEVICDADVTNYPFDKQYCSLNFVSYGYGEEWMKVTFTSSKILLTQYQESGLWDIEDTATFSRIANGLTEVVVGLNLKRRSAYYIAGLVLPMTIVAILQSFVFLLPNDSGERVGFSVTVLLASVVFLTIIQEKLPESSEPNISILGFLLFGYVSLGVLVTLCVILSSNMHMYEESKPVPAWLRVLFCLKRNKVDEDFSTGSTIRVASKEESRDEESISSSWKDVAKAFDRYCFISSLSLYALQFVIYFAIVL